MTNPRQLTRAVVAPAILAMSCAAACSTSTTPREVDRISQIASTPPAARLDVATLPGRWWQWAEASAPAESPIDDGTGADCAENQPGDVWFLAGTHGGSVTRSCTVPAGRPVYFPVLNQVCTVVAGQDPQVAAQRCSAPLPVADAELDGSPLKVTEATSPSAFTLTVASGASGLGPGKHLAVTWGMWVGPFTMASGSHTLTFTGEAGSFTTSATYHLTVG